jgi:sulfur carrier protein|tara:strand:+ start:10 stop:228 length:219 start_codon:yes stop_codon:yes gene_type:complete
MKKKNKIKIKFNGKNILIDKSSNIDNLIKQFNIKLNNVAIEYNNKIIDKKKIKKIMLKNKDFIEVVHFIGGG